jgi:two-component system, NarL family, nitrate/nitrite response regulator NarL
VTPGHSTPKRILIADDHEVVRRRFCSLLESHDDFQIVGEASNGAEAVKKTLALNPDIVLLDVTMPVMDGISAARIIHKDRPGIPILIISMHEGAEMVRAVQSAGAQAFVSKSDIGTSLLPAVDALLDGQTYFRK